MELRNLVYFLQLYDDRNYSIAASKLYITQQALSKSIHNMEVELNTKLFIKTNTGIIPSETAISIEPICREMVSHYQNGLKRIEHIIKYSSYPIRIAVSIQTADTLSFTLFQDFASKFPSISIQQNAMFDLAAEEELINNDVDFAFTVNKPEKCELFHVETIRHIPLCILVNSSHPLANKEYVEINDLDHKDLYCAGKGFKTYSLLTEKAKEQNVSPNFIPASGYLYNTYKNIFEHNQAVIGLLTEDIGDNFKDVKKIPFRDPDMTWNICLCWRKDHELTHEEQTFLAYVLEFKDSNH